MILPLLFACGDPIVDTTYRGEPLWYVEGTISAPEELNGLGIGDEVLASLFWITNLSDDPEEGLTGGVQTSLTAEVRFPATFEIRVYEAPPPGSFVDLDRRYAAGLLMIYVDQDRNGFFNADDRMVGATTNKVLIFANDEIPAASSPTEEIIPAGYSLANAPLKCPSERLELGLDAPRPVDFMQCIYGEPSEYYCPPATRCNARNLCEPTGALTITVINDGQQLDKNAVCGPPLY